MALDKGAPEVDKSANSGDQAKRPNDGFDRLSL
jgi:hypothetical protein